MCTNVYSVQTNGVPITLHIIYHQIIAYMMRWVNTIIYNYCYVYISLKLELKIKLYRPQRITKKYSNNIYSYELKGNGIDLYGQLFLFLVILYSIILQKYYIHIFVKF